MFENRISELARKRAELHAVEESIKEAEAALSETELGQILANLRKVKIDTAVALSEIDVTFRKEAEKHVRESGNLSIHPAVTVKMTTALKYDTDEAIQWARTTKPELVDMKLRTRDFEKMARQTPPAFVKISKEPKIAIASDLSQYAAPANDNDTGTIL